MPGYKKKRTTKRKGRRRTKKKTRGAFFKTSPPKYLNATFVYHHDQLQLPGTAVSRGERAFRANGMWDPYVPAGGGQPRMFDQLCGSVASGTGALYANYRVNASRIDIWAYNQNATFGVYLFIIPSQKVVAVSASMPLSDIKSIPNTRKIYLPPLKSGAARRTKKISFYIPSVAKFLNVSKKELSLSAQYDANPVALANFIIMAVNENDATALASNDVICDVKETFYSTLFGRNMDIWDT